MKRLGIAILFSFFLAVLQAAEGTAYYSPSGNPEIWVEKPQGYFTVAEWAAAHPPPAPVPLTLDEAKLAKKAAIDANTDRLRDRDGLAHAGERFAMSPGAMLKWTGLMAAKDMLQFPLVILTMDDQPFALADKNALMGFLMAVMAYETAEGSPLTSGRILRARVEAAQTIEEVDAIVDDRE